MREEEEQHPVPCSSQHHRSGTLASPGVARGCQCQPREGRGSLASAGAAAAGRVPIPRWGTRAPKAVRSPRKCCLPIRIPPALPSTRSASATAVGTANPAAGPEPMPLPCRGSPQFAAQSLMMSLNFQPRSLQGQFIIHNTQFVEGAQIPRPINIPSPIPELYSPIST